MFQKNNSQRLPIDIDIFQNCLIDIDINFFKNDHINIDVHISTTPLHVKSIIKLSEIAQQCSECALKKAGKITKTRAVFHKSPFTQVNPSLARDFVPLDIGTFDLRKDNAKLPW